MILVTGASGNVGGKLVTELLGTGGEDIRVLVRDPDEVAHLDPVVQRAVGDLDRPETLPAALAGVRCAFLVTMGFGPHQDRSFVQAAQQAGVEHIVKLSTLEASTATLTIGKWHRENEQVIEGSGLGWTLLRPGMFMSNALNWIPSIKGTGGVFFPGGNGRMAPIDPADVAKVAALALTRPGHDGKRYELTGPQVTSTAEMVATLSRVLGRPLKYRDVPIFLAKIFMRRNGMDPRLATAMGELARSLRRGEQATQTSTLHELLGQSGGTFEEWCRRHAELFR